MQLIEAIAALPNKRITTLSEAGGVYVEHNESANRVERVRSLFRHPDFRLSDALRRATLDELRDLSAALDLNIQSRARIDYIDAIIEHLGDAEALPSQREEEIVRDRSDRSRTGAAPEEGDVVELRQGRWLVEAVSTGARVGDKRATHLVRAVGLDDDRRGEVIEVLWELELGARVVEPGGGDIGMPNRLDDPRLFGAWLDAIQWQGVTASESKLFQAPFRAGIKQLQHQLIPLARALELPRANLFIADDVGLGKTIEAGLVLQELRLRQRVHQVLIVAPPAICVQWQEEMRDRFGLHFELYNQDYIARVRRERGYAVNPFTTHTRFIISYHMLRRAEHQERLIAAIGNRARHSLLILDEAHTVAPSSGSVYATDSQLTGVIRDIAPRYENRLFLSATPHNGHSNSFSALLEILDPQRFNRGLPVDEQAQSKLDEVMVRRLKSDLRGKTRDLNFPERIVEALRLTRKGDDWQIESNEGTTTIEANAPPFELQLSELLSTYQERAQALADYPPMVFTTLQKRLLSSVYAFHNTFCLHDQNQQRRAHEAPRRRRSAKGGSSAATAQFSLNEEGAWDDEQEVRDRALMKGDEGRPQRETTTAEDANIEAERELQTLRDKIRKLAERHVDTHDARFLALEAWLRQHVCHIDEKGRAKWQQRRVIIFTEYCDTLKILHDWLRLAFPDNSAERIAIIQGGTDQDERERIKRDFNDAASPLRILLATDAAREGINLQAQCHDLFHYDLPWNPARLEQRNGRIDRQMQPAPQVFCRHFIYEERPEDRVLDTLVRKVDTIQRELGSMGALLTGELQRLFDDGIQPDDAARLASVDLDQRRRERITAELEQTRKQVARDLGSVARILEASRKYAHYSPERLRDVVTVALRSIELGTLQECEVTFGQRREKTRAWRVPEQMPAAWQSALDTLRPPRRPDESLWQWRQHPPRPVVFDAPPVLTDSVVHLHLEHPFVKRLLAGFRARGFVSRKLERTTLLVDPTIATPRLVAYARLTMFGSGASRLHDQVFAIDAQFELSGNAHAPADAHEELTIGDRVDKAVLDRVESLIHDDIDDSVPPELEAQLLARIPQWHAALWEWLEAEGDSIARDVQQKLDLRGEQEARKLRELLTTQKKDLQKKLGPTQQSLIEEPTRPEEIRQLERERRYMEERLLAIDGEMETEPDELRDLYRLQHERVEPLGLVILWPGTR